VRSLREEGREMARFNDLCPKDATGYCALCEARAVADRFVRRWFTGGLFLEGVQVLKRARVFAWLHRFDAWFMARLRKNWYPRAGVRHQDIVREAHKQYSETINKTMLTLLGVALFCLLTTCSSPDRLLLAPDSTLKVPFADTPMSFVGFILVAPLLLIVLTIYLHVFYGYWLDCERQRQDINKRLIPPIESIPTLFSFPDEIPRLFTAFVFYLLVPLVLVVITWKAKALPLTGYPLLGLLTVVTLILTSVWLCRCPDDRRSFWAFVYYIIPVIFLGLTLLDNSDPHLFQRPLKLSRAEFPKEAWLAGIDMRHARANFAKLEEAHLERAILQGADLYRAKLKGAHLLLAKLQEADLQGADLQGADLRGADLRGANLRKANLTKAKNLTQDQVNTACVDEDTELPEGLIRPASCPVKP
jgi:hypothetical protein